MDIFRIIKWVWDGCPLPYFGGIPSRSTTRTAAPDRRQTEQKDIEESTNVWHQGKKPDYKKK